MYKNNLITVIDFETATIQSYSICAVGLAVIKEGEIIEKQRFLVQPPNNKYSDENIAIHGITPETTANADLFPEVWARIYPYFQNAYIAAHNASFDMGLLKTTLAYYQIEQPHFLYIDTLNLLNEYLEYGEHRTLNALCEKFNIPLEKHHDPLCDATATANLILYYYRVKNFENFTQLLNKLYLRNYGEVTIKKMTSFAKFKKSPAASAIIASVEVNAEKDPDFDGKTVLFTGELSSMTREQAMQEVVKRGGIIKDGGVTRAVNILVNANPPEVATGKVKKALELQAQGFQIKIVDEKTFLKMISDNSAVEL